ncbi:AaceriABR219Wp [[Ashbya] aceris (nom. inval.)]|nr:AaceriABR219Wp [[Ashbya] aceris (nom. inval.)]
MQKCSSTMHSRAKNTGAVEPPSGVLWSKIKQPQFYWFLGHFLTLYHYGCYTLSFRQAAIRYQYGSILFYVAVTYGIVLYQFYKSGQLKPSTLKVQIRTLDNLQYFVLTLVLWTCRHAKIISTATMSPVIFALFHSINYFKESLLPLLPLQAATKTALAGRISFFITNYNERFLMIAQNSEFVTLVQVLLLLPVDCTVLLLRFTTTNLLKVLAVVTYAWFFKLRYLQSPQMKAMVHTYDVRADQLVRQSLPQLLPYWLHVKHLVLRFFKVIPC